jgi:hypothetical protein
MTEFRVGILLVAMFAPAIGALAQATTEPTTAPSSQLKKAMDELWRRGNCLLSDVYQPADIEGALPKDLGQTPVLHPRVRTRQGTLLCYARDGGTIWAADDQCLHQIDAAGGKLVRTLDLAAGLPDEPIQSIAPAGGKVWLATRGHLACVDVQAGAVSPAVAGVEFQLGRLAAGGGGVWLVADAGAWYLAAGQTEWRKLPDFPGRDRLAELAHRGFWNILWHNKLRVLLPSIAANADGLYVVCTNRLLHYPTGGGEWKEITDQAWQATVAGRTAWALTTDGVVRYDAATGKTTRYAGAAAGTPAGQGPAPGRPVDLAVGDKAVFLASQGDYDEKAKRFAGGGISRLDLATGQWSTVEELDGADVRFPSAVLADGEEGWAACELYDKVIEMGAHPGMAHIKRWRPHASGLGLLHYAAGKWTLTRREGLKTEQRWVMGQKGKVNRDRLGLETVEALCRCGDALWGVYRMVPDQYYAGYLISAGCLAARAGDAWQGRFDVRTDELGMSGEQPELMLISRSHGDQVVLADGQPIVLGVENVAGRAVVVAENGVFALGAGDGAGGRKFAPLLAEPDRLYWRATCAAAGDKAVWFGGDAGTVSRLDRKTGRLELIGVAAGRKITAMAARGDGVIVRIEKSQTVLPVALAAAPPKLPDGDTLAFDGKAWSVSTESVDAPKSAFTCKAKGSYLYRGEGDRPAAFLQGIFRPIVLCEDPAGGKLWVGSYAGVASVPLPPAPPEVGK